MSSECTHCFMVICCDFDFDDPVLVVKYLILKMVKDVVSCRRRVEKLLQPPNESPERQVIIDHLKVIVLPHCLLALTLEWVQAESS